MIHASRLSPKEVFVDNLLAYEVLSSSERSFGTISPFIPNTYEGIEKYIKLKRKALCKYTTEIRGYPHPRSPEGIEILAQRRGMDVGLKYAEAFQLIRTVAI